LLHIRPQNTSGLIQAEFNFLQGEKNDEDFVVKACLHIIDGSRRFYHSTNFERQSISDSVLPS
jgi:hypothetical protein